MADQLQRWIAQRARELRKLQTPQERELWQQLRAKRFSGFKFRRQEPIGRYIADFVCFRARLIVELDGSQHQQDEQDKSRDSWLRDQDFKILRFWNNEWEMQAELVLEEIWRTLQDKSSSHSPSTGEGLGEMAQDNPHPNPPP